MPLKNGKTTASLQTILIGSVIPAGTIAPFGGGTVPEGWLLCDGSTVSRSTYSSLYEAVGTVHGQGDGSTTFHLPDLRGRFLRGADNMGTGAAGRDPDAASRTAANTGGATGNTVGSVQGDAMQGHWHNYRANVSVNLSGGDENSTVITETSSTINTTDSLIRDAVTNGSNGTPRLASESRPQNANVEYIIKV
jgi:microcystin-dependent protein